MKNFILFFSFFFCIHISADVFVDKYGAKGDGKTDDTKAIQNAIDAIGEGKVIFSPNKTYLVNSLYIIDKSWIMIEGNKAILRRIIQPEYTTYENAGIICIFSGKNIIIQNVTFDGQFRKQKAAGFNMGIFIGSIKNRNTFFDNNHGDDKVNKNITIKNCKFLNTGMNNTGVDKFGDGIYAHATDSLSVVNNTFNNMGRWGIACSESMNILIKKNTISNTMESPALGGIDIENEGDDHKNGSYSRNVLIMQNVLNGRSSINLQTGVSKKNSKGKFHYLNNVVVKDNILNVYFHEPFGKAGIFVSAVDQENIVLEVNNLTIQNNIITSINPKNGNGIEFYLFGEKMDFKNINIAGNKIYGFKNGIITNKSVVPVFKNVAIKDNKIVSHGVGEKGSGISVFSAKYLNFQVENNFIEDYSGFGIQTIYNYPHIPDAQVNRNNINFKNLRPASETKNFDIMDVRQKLNSNKINGK